MTAPPTARPDPDDVPRMAEHVDHEMSRLLWIGETLRCWRLLLPDTEVPVLLLAVPAWCLPRPTVVEELEERPRVRGVGGAQSSDDDVWLGDYTGTFDAHPWPTPPHIHRDRLRDADKLVGHVSTGRLGLGGRPEWGDSGDRDWVRAVIVEIKGDVSAAGRWDWFPETERAIAETRS